MPALSIVSPLQPSTALGCVPHPHALRQALRSHPTGITIITARTATGRAIGLTVNSFNSISLDPALVVWCLSQSSSSFAEFQAVSHFAVHVLAHDQSTLSQHFSSKGQDKFQGLASVAGLGGAPLLDGCCARFECRNESRVMAGDHCLFIGAVERFSTQARAPLIYHDGRYQGLRELGQS